jgi:hypothetical protein
MPACPVNEREVQIHSVLELKRKSVPRLALKCKMLLLEFGNKSCKIGPIRFAIFVFPPVHM